MNEVSSEESAAIVSRVYLAAIEALSAGQDISPVQRLIHDVEHLMQETNSAASFEQYFRWASVREMSTIVGSLEKLGLDHVADLTRKAISIAFPTGIPRNEDEQSALSDWSPDQESEFSRLFRSLEVYNGQVMNVLSAWAAKAGA